MQLKVRSLEKQMRAKLSQKIKKNKEMKDKMDLLNDINESKR